MAIKQQSREGTRFTRFATQSAGVVGTPWVFIAALASVGDLADPGTALRLLRRLATGDELLEQHHHLPDGLPDPEFAEPRLQSDQPQARRGDSRHPARGERND